MSRSTAFLLCTAFCLLTFLGCDIFGSDTEDSDPVPQGGEDFTYSEDAQSVDLGEVSVSEKSGSEIVFDVTGSDLDVEEGEVLVSDVPEDDLETAPRFLREVESVQQEGNQVTVETRQATLVEAVEEASLDFSTSVEAKSGTGSPATWKVTSTAKGVKAKSCDAVEIKDVSLADTTENTEIGVALENGTVSFCPGIDGTIDISGLSLEEFSTTASGDLTYNTDLTAAAKAALEDSGTLDLATFESYGVVGPVQYTLQLTLVAGYEAEAGGSTELTTGLESNGSIELGARYKDGDWSPISDRSLSFNSRPVEWGKEAGATVKGYVRPELTVFLYETAGPKLSTGPYVELAAERSEDLVKDYRYGVYGGVDGGVGFDVEILTLDIAEYNKEVFDYRVEIAGEGPTNPTPNEPNSPSPADGETTSGTSPTLTWEASDPDNDELRYDVYLGTSNSPSQAASGLSSKSYDTSNLESGTTYNWKVVVTDQDGATAESPVWGFTTPSSPSDNQAPNEPNSPSPADGETTSGTSPTLTWEASDPDGDDLTYDVYFGTSSSPSLAASDLASASYDTGSLENETTYYWQVVAKDPSGATTEGPVWNFQTPSGSPSNSGLADAPWPRFGQDIRTTARGPNAGPTRGTVAWTFDAGTRTKAPSVGGDGTVYLGDQDGLHAIASDGMGKWTYSGNVSGSDTRDNVNVVPAIASDGTLYLASDSDYAHAVNSSGNRQWIRQVCSQCNIAGSPAVVSDGTVYLGTNDGELYALTPDGSVQWTFDANGRVVAPAVASDGTVYVGAGTLSFDNSVESGHVYAVSPDGVKEWGYETGGEVKGDPAIGPDGTVYVGALDGKIYALRADGTLKWTYETGGRIRSSPAVGSDGTIYIGSNDNYLYALNPDGTLKWRYQTGDNVRSSPAIGGDGRIYFGSSDGLVYALSSDGEEVWSFDTGNPIRSSPAIGAGGRLYIGSGTKLYAIGE